jgi:hypothetical protein
MTIPTISSQRPRAVTCLNKGCILMGQALYLLAVLIKLQQEFVPRRSQLSHLCGQIKEPEHEFPDAKTEIKKAGINNLLSHAGGGDVVQSTQSFDTSLLVNLQDLNNLYSSRRVRLGKTLFPSEWKARLVLKSWRPSGCVRVYV